MMGYEQRRHTRFVHADADAVAGHAGLRDFKYRITNAVSITDADLIVWKSLNREVLAELTECEIIAPKKALPVLIGIRLVDKYGALFPTVTCEIRLRVAIDIELPNGPPPFNREFPDSCPHSSAVPCDLTRKTGVQ